MVKVVMYARFATNEQITGAISTERPVPPEAEVSRVHPSVNRTNVSLNHRSSCVDHVLSKKVHP